MTSVMITPMIGSAIGAPSASETIEIDAATLDPFTVVQMTQAERGALNGADP
jgi:hypothetical protein